MSKSHQLAHHQEPNNPTDTEEHAQAQDSSRRDSSQQARSFSKESERQMPAVQLPNGHQVEHCHQGSKPPRQKQRVRLEVCSGRKFSPNPMLKTQGQKV